MAVKLLASGLAVLAAIGAAAIGMTNNHQLITGHSTSQAEGWMPAITRVPYPRDPESEDPDRRWEQPEETRRDLVAGGEPSAQPDWSQVSGSLVQSPEE